MCHRRSHLGEKKKKKKCPTVVLYGSNAFLFAARRRSHQQQRPLPLLCPLMGLQVNPAPPSTPPSHI